VVDPKAVNVNSHKDKYQLYQLSKDDHDKSGLMDIFAVPFIALKSYIKISKQPETVKSLKEVSGLDLSNLVGDIMAFLLNFGQGKTLDAITKDQYYLLRLQNLQMTKVVNIPKTLVKVLVMYGNPNQENNQLIPVLSLLEVWVKSPIMLEILKTMPVNIGNGKDMSLQEFLKDSMKKLAEESQKGSNVQKVKVIAKALVMIQKIIKSLIV